MEVEKPQVGAPKSHVMTVASLQENWREMEVEAPIMSCGRNSEKKSQHLSAQASLSHCDCPWGDKLIRVTVAGIPVQDPPASRLGKNITMCGLLISNMLSTQVGP